MAATLRDAFAVEVLKLRRSKVTWLTLLPLAVMPVVCGLFMWIVMEPERAVQLGLVGQKAQLVGLDADWPSFVLLLLQVAGMGGVILASIIAAYVFGREYAEGTAGQMLAMPVARHWHVAAKLGVVLAWFLALLAWLVIEGLAVGWYLGLPGWSPAMAWRAVADILMAGLVAWLLVPVVAWVAMRGRGYLAPVGFAVFMLVMGSILGATGWGKWFPWSIVPLFAGVAGPRVEHLVPGSMVVLGITFAVGIALGVWELRNADVA